MSSDFEGFHHRWVEQLRLLVQQLGQVPIPPSTDEHHRHLSQLVQKVMSHFVEYDRAKSVACNHDVLGFFKAPWLTSLERSLHWVGGWRPTTAFHLIYTESSILFESHVIDILRGFHTGDLGDLSPGQFRRVSELQCETVQAENGITDELSHWQDEIVGDLLGMYGDVERRMERLAGILRKADELRLKTIDSLVELLTPRQAAEFLVAAFELNHGIRGWGIQQDRRRAGDYNPNNNN